MNKKKKNYGFTLVELLAVIIVLSVIMVLAAPSVLNTMNSAKKKSFAMYGQKVLTNAQTIFQAYTLMGEPNANLIPKDSADETTYCINIKNLGMTNMGKYIGYVIIKGPDATNDNSVAEYTVYLNDQVDYMFNGTAGTELTVGNVLKYKSTDFKSPTGYSGCFSSTNQQSSNN